MSEGRRVLPSGYEISDAEEAEMLRALETSLALHRPLKRMEACGRLVWYAVHTKAREELKAATNLLNQRFGVFYPRMRVTVAHGRRKIVVERPFLPRYLFVRMGVQESVAPVNITVGVSTIVHVPNRAPLAIPDAVIDELMGRANDDGLVAVTAEERFRIGQDVRITGGPFEMFIATIARIEGEAVRAFVDIFQRRTPIVVGMDQVEEVHVARGPLRA